MINLDLNAGMTMSENTSKIVDNILKKINNIHGFTNEKMELRQHIKL